MSRFIIRRGKLLQGLKLAQEMNENQWKCRDRRRRHGDSGDPAKKKVKGLIRLARRHGDTESHEMGRKDCNLRGSPSAYAHVHVKQMCRSMDCPKRGTKR